MSSELEQTGLLLVGHGTRDDTGTRQFLELADGLKGRLQPLTVEAAFLELAQPGIQVAVENLLTRGIQKIVTAPLILFAAGHVKRDIPSQVAAAIAARGRADISQVQAGHLGCHEAIVELSRARMEAAERGGASAEGASRQASGNEESAATARSKCLLLVARGSSDEAAAKEMREFANRRQRDLIQMQVEVAFLAKARPSFDEQLAKWVATGCQRVIVQPHFLFEGELVDRIRGQTAEAASRQPKTEWIVTQPLADPVGKPGLASELLAKVILDRCGAAGIRVVASPDDD